MEVRKFQYSDYPSLYSWWTAHKWQPVAIEALPKTGLVIEGVCAGFIYKTDSNMCLIEWIISNPETDKNVRNDALDLLINKLVDTAKEMGFTLAFTSVQHQGLLKRYENHKFIVTDQQMTNMIRVL
jgi:hypothetical protein